jgi:nucleotide-binding universal stress UspA family protein
MYKTVMVATDGSESAQRAVETAIELTRSFGTGARLHIVAVINYVDVPGPLGKQPDGAPDLLGDEVSQALEAAEKLAGPSGVDYQVHRLEGEVVETILKCAAGTGTDILVAGVTGRSRLARLVMGSVVEKLVRSTHLPVVVVPRPALA